MAEFFKTLQDNPKTAILCFIGLIILIEELGSAIGEWRRK